ncbi:hypothetical protein IHN63_14275, partial [Deinococcus sp. 6YEL10]|nr:hypothetical protein [Deinococcus sp. 6YEL10]
MDTSLTLLSGGTEIPADRDAAARDLLGLTAAALASPDLAGGVTPTLEKLVRDTAAVGSAYFQTDTRALT